MKPFIPLLSKLALIATILLLAHFGAIDPALMQDLLRIVLAA